MSNSLNNENQRLLLLLNESRKQGDLDYDTVYCKYDKCEVFETYLITYGYDVCPDHKFMINQVNICINSSHLGKCNKCQIDYCFNHLKFLKPSWYCFKCLILIN